MDDGLLAALVGGAAGLVTAGITIWDAGRRDRGAEQRKEAAQALAAVAAYAEFPYVIRRRRADAPGEERVRISSELAKVQAELAFHSAWLKMQSPHLGDAYDAYVREARRLAGAAMREAWQGDASTSDASMNMPDLGLLKLEPLKERYMIEVGDHLAMMPRWSRRLGRRVRQRMREV